jgi:hypothetical protein
MKDPLVLLALDALPALDTVLAAVDAVLEAELPVDTALERDEDATREAFPPPPPVPVTGGSGPSTSSHPTGAAKNAAKRSFERSTRQRPEQSSVRRTSQKNRPEGRPLF